MRKFGRNDESLRLFTRLCAWWASRRALRYCTRLPKLARNDFDNELMQLAANDSTSHLSEALRLTPRIERRLLLLYHLRQLSQRQIAARLELPDAEALRQLSRAVNDFYDQVRTLDRSSNPCAPIA